ncbi:MAG: hypothetical protein ACTIMA_07595 [Brachybacterium tyrofermentans]|uniref:Uncharacterized protein n=1 Tax=Brachybacterium tyrofermentans TaxID=47848 RepID=A0ABW0FH61_9MICO
MTTARRPGALALLGALTLALSSCSLLPAGDGPELADDDVITIGNSAAGMFGYFGHGSTTVAADTISQRYELPNGAEIYETTDELDPEARDLIEVRAGKYVAWEGKLSEKRRAPCTDIAATSVSISGSITHDSDVQDCADDTPLHTLKQSVRDAEPELFGQLAHPIDDWTIEIRPWTEEGPAGGGPDESAPIERYELSAAQHEIGMGITAQNAPADWGADLAPEEGNGAPLGWDNTGLVLTDLNAFLLNQKTLGCGDQTGEIRMTKHGKPAQTWTYRLCPGQHSEALAQTLRGL